MNMMISTAPVAVRTSTDSQALATRSQAGENGFSGMLVQAITGTTDAASTGSTPLSLGLIGIFGQLGASQQDGQSEDLMQLLDNLLERLQQLEEGDGLSDEQLSSLASLLAAFQGVVQHLAFDQWTGASDSENGYSMLLGFQPAFDSQYSNSTVVGALRESLQQLVTLLGNDASIAAGTSQLGNEINGLLRMLDGQLNTANVEVKAQSNGKTLSETIDAIKSNEAAFVTLTKDAEGQAQSATVDLKRYGTVLRDPVWRFQVVGNADSVSADSLTANVAPVLAGEQASEAGSQPAWTLLSQDAKAIDTLQAKAALPTQVPVQQFAQQVDKLLLKQFSLTQTGGLIEAKLSLTPEHLGQVDVRIVMQNGQLTAQFVAENRMARDLIESQMAQLRLSLQAQGLQVDRLEVVQQSSSTSNASFLHQDHRQSASGGNRNGEEGHNDSGTYDESLDFEEELEITSTIRDLAYGNRLNVTA